MMEVGEKVKEGAVVNNKAEDELDEEREGTEDDKEENEGAAAKTKLTRIKAMKVSG